MPIYEFVCKSCETAHEVERKMKDAGDPYDCPDCGNAASRVFFAAPSVWNTEGSHNGTYGKGNVVGTKADALNKAWGKHYKEAPPKPATDIR